MTSDVFIIFSFESGVFDRAIFIESEHSCDGGNSFNQSEYPNPNPNPNAHPDDEDIKLLVKNDHQDDGDTQWLVKINKT